mgnify:CR=1 FL=1
MQNINFLKNKIKIKNEIISDLKNFQKIDKNNKISVLPDVHLKKGEMSPTGCVLVSDKITPSFTHLSVGSGISSWSIDVDNNFDLKKFDSLFKFLKEKIPGTNLDNKKLHNFTDKQLENFFKFGPSLFAKKKLFNKSFLKNIENEGNFAKNIKNKISYEKSVPDYIKKIAKKNFATLGTGNTFIELHEIKEDFTNSNSSKKKLFFYIHSGIPEAYLTMFYSPRWGLHGEKFIPFEKTKWDFFGKHLIDKDSIVLKKNFFPSASKYFGLDPNSYDGNLYLSSMAYLCNMAIANRIYLATIINTYLKNKLNIKNMTLIWDCIHDSIKKEVINKKIKIVHRHGASPVYNDNYIKKNLKNNRNYKKVVIPSKPGGESLIAIIKGDIGKYNNSICHGSGRLLDRPVARAKYSHNLTKKKISDKVNKLYFTMKDISGENPNSFRSLEEIIKILEKEKLIKKLYITTPKYILKS